MTHDDALMYGAIMVILAAMNGIIINHYYMAGFHNGLKVRVSVCSLIYKKVLLCLCAYLLLYLLLKRFKNQTYTKSVKNIFFLLNNLGIALISNSSR